MKLENSPIRPLLQCCWLVVLTLATMLPLTADAARTTYFDDSCQGDEAFAVASDASGNVSVAGATQSIDLPGVSAGAQTQLGGRRDGFVAEYNATLTRFTLAPATLIAPIAGLPGSWRVRSIARSCAA